MSLRDLLKHNIRLVAVVLWSSTYPVLGQVSQPTTAPSPLVRKATREASFRRLNHPIVATAVTSDGKKIASAGGNYASITDSSSGKELLKLKAAKGMAFTTLAFSPDGRWLAGGQNKLDHRKTIKKKGYEIQQLFYSGEIVIWDTETGVVQATLNDDNRQAWTLAFSPDGKWLAMGSGPIIDINDKACGDLCQGTGGVILWDTGTWKRVRQLQGETALIFSLAFSPDGKFVAGGTGRRGLQYDSRAGQKTSVNQPPQFAVFVWDAQTGELVKTLPSHTRAVTAIAFSPDGLRLASTGRDQLLKIWDSRSWELVNSVSVSRLPMTFMGTLTGNPKEYANGRYLPAHLRYPPKMVCLRALAFTLDRQKLVGSDSDGFIRFYDLGSGEMQQAMALSDQPIETGDIVFDNAGLQNESSPPPSAIYTWSIMNQEPYRLFGFVGVLLSMSLSADGKLLVAGNSDGKIRLLGLD